MGGTWYLSFLIIWQRWSVGDVLEAAAEVEAAAAADAVEASALVAAAWEAEEMEEG